MKEFLKGQFDYIFFFYGFSFILLAFACFTLSKDKLRKFPWITLGLFGLLHGINEWLAMINIMTDYAQTLPMIELGFLTASYLCLFEFARRGLSLICGVNLTRWTYLALLLLIPFSRAHGLAGWAVAARYGLGFPAAYAAARITLEFSKKEKKESWALLALSITLAFYAVATGLIVPQAPFLPANIVNHDTFFDKTGIPIQLVRGIIGLFAALSVWFYSSTAPEKKYTSAYAIPFVPAKWLIALTLVAVLSVGWLFTNHLDYYAGIQAIKKNKSRSASEFNRLIEELTRLERATLSLSRAWEIHDILSSKTPQNITRAKTILNIYKTKFNAMNCALLDMQGFPVDLAGEEKSYIKMGQSYAAMPFFREALKGGYGYYFKLGPVYKERIYYISHPVTTGGGKITGVVAIEKMIYAEPLFQYRLFSILLTFIICTIALAFFIALKKREAFIAFIEKANAELAELDRMKSLFISTVSHELRTPLTSIKNAATILKKGGPTRRLLDEYGNEMLDIIMDNTERQTRMIEDLLDVSKIESGVMSASPRSSNINILIKETLTSLRPLADNKKIDVNLDLNTPSGTVYADPELVRRILNNLIVNAIKFTNKNGTISISTDDTKEEVKITVSDTGIGISDADQKHIFEKFYRSSGTSSSDDKGCGLGLVITKGLVETQGGKIWIESEINKGSSFYFTLPKHKPDIRDDKPA